MASSDDKPVEIFHPPNRLRSKVSDQGAPLSEKLTKAEDTIRQLSQDYPNWALEDLAKLEAIFTRVEAENKSGITEGDIPAKTALREAYRVSHDMRGQGGSFGYPLITHIATSLCRFIDTLETADKPARAILTAHAAAMRAILENNISGEGGPLGHRIVTGLEQATANYSVGTIKL